MKRPEVGVIEVYPQDRLPGIGSKRRIRRVVEGITPMKAPNHVYGWVTVGTYRVPVWRCVTAKPAVWVVWQSEWRYLRALEDGRADLAAEKARKKAEKDAGREGSA